MEGQHLSLQIPDQSEIRAKTHYSLSPVLFYHRINSSPNNAISAWKSKK